MGIKVLWVEDEPGSLAYERQVATREGWQITSADTIEDALRFIETERFELLVLDLILARNEYCKRRGQKEPEAGLELLREVRDPRKKRATPPDVRVLVVTAVVTHAIIGEVIGKLATQADYITKPVTLDFAATVDRVNRELLGMRPLK